jgi:ribosomal protein S18 acetylase RimI-like enzyme
MPLRFVSAASVSLAEYAAAFTAGFQGYQFPVSMNAAALARRVRFEQYDLENSLVAYDDAGLAGVAALAVRGDAGWVAGFGVVPARRGAGVGREMMSALLQRARACGLRRLSLEVLAGNTAARRLYESAGMRVARDLLIMERAERAGGPASLDEAPAAELLGHFARLHAVRPAWQRDLPSLLVANLRGFRLGVADAPRAYALVGRALDGSHFISDLAAADADAARELCAGLTGLAPFLKIVNEPADGLFVGPLSENGFVETTRQHELRMDL